MERGVGVNLLENMGIRVYKRPFLCNGIEIGYPFNLNDLVKKGLSDLIPESLGIYHLFYEGRLVYIGMSKKIKGRLLYHLKSKDMVFDSVLWFCTRNLCKENPIKKTLDIEAKMIKYHKPNLNTQYISLVS